MYNATLYLNTGFNAINIPDSAATLNRVSSANKVTVPALDIYQARELSSFVIKCTNYAQIRNADYLYLVNTADSTDFAYYSIQSITMTSMDTAVLYVTMDYILTAGGVSNLQFTDGICERHHVALADDVFGKYDEDDPYMTPAEMLKIESVKPDFKGSDSDSNITIVESTVDLYAQYYEHTHTGRSLAGIDYKSDDNVVTVPTVYKSQHGTTAKMGKSASTYYETRLPDVAMYVADNGGTSISPYSGFDFSWIKEAISLVRSLGIESCIIGQYCVPYYMVKDSTFFSNWQPPNGTAIGASDGAFDNLIGAHKTVDLSTLPFIRTYSGLTIRNKRLFYGDHAQYTIISTASGNKASFYPEEIFASGDTYPTIEMRVDPRPKGMPYFRFDTYRGDASEDMFFVNAVKGLEWQNAPLVYEGASGSLLNQYNFNAKMAAGYENANYAYMSGQLTNQQANANAITGMVGSVLSGVGYGLTGNAGGMLGAAADAASSAINLGYTNAQYELAKSHQEASWNIQKNAEMQSLLIQNNLVAPSMQFPISEGIRDYVGNDCLVYRTYYSDNDAARIDKILTMYGYKHTTPITNSLLTNRAKFNYIKAAGVSIKNTGIPQWLRDGVSAQFSVGTRIWHVLPDTSAYTDGTNT